VNLWLLFLALGVGGFNWIAVEKNWKRVKYITKPTVILLFLAWLWQNHSLGGGMLWFSLGLVFSLAGDVLLLLPANFFLPGLVAFLLAHVMYLVGFNLSITSISVPILIVSLLFFGGTQLYYRRLARSLRESGQENLKLPVAFYTTIISLMAISAMFTLANPVWNSLYAVMATCGAILFVLSDSLLAWDRFVAPISHGHLLVMLTYHLGQLGIILGAALHFH
jgi:uncharacterized membrane protein YhhN